MREYTLSNGMEAKPLLEAKLRRFSTPSYEEESATGVDGYSVQKSTYNQAILSVGSYFENKIDEKSKFITDLRAGYDFQHDDNTVSAAYTLLQDYTTSNGIDNGGLVYKAGFAYEVDQDDIIFNIGYDLNGQGSDYQNHMLSAKALYKF
jgi:hypothetical protein